MCPRQSLTLVPLTRLTPIKRKFKLMQVKQYAFEKIMRIVAQNNLLTHKYFNEAFKIHTGDSAFQLGAVISQKGKPIDFYGRKLTDDQQRYTVTHRELISIT